VRRKPRTALSSPTRRLDSRAAARLYCLCRDWQNWKSQTGGLNGKKGKEFLLTFTSARIDKSEKVLGANRRHGRCLNRRRKVSAGVVDCVANSGFT
jgi:hypothetical protein